MYQNKRPVNEQRNHENAVIAAIVHGIGISFHQVEKLDVSRFSVPLERHFVSTFKDLYDRPQSQPSFKVIEDDIHTQLHRDNSLSKSDFDAYMKGVERLERTRAPSNDATFRAFQALSINVKTPDLVLITDKTEYEKTDLDEALEGLDPYSPPKGAVKDIFDFMQASATRAVPEIALLDALQCTSILLGGKATITRLKLNLITMGIAPSASGKDNGQSIIKQALSHVGMLKIVSSSITSQKAIAQTIINNEGRAAYIADEGHAFFDAANDTNGAQYIKQASADILSLYTDKCYAIRDQERRELEARVEKLENKLDKLYSKQAELDEGTPAKTDKITDLETQTQYINGIINSGIKNPQLNAAFYSVPRKMDGVITLDSVESGLAGRALVARASEERQRKRINRLAGEKPPEFDAISEQVINLYELSAVGEFEIQLEESARSLAIEIEQWFEARINDSQAGAIYARGMDNVLKLAALASIPSSGKCFSLVSMDCLMWAFKVVHQSISNMKDLLVMNTPNDDIQQDNELLYTRVRQISNGRFTGLGTFKDKLSSKKWKDMLSMMEVRQAQDEAREPSTQFIDIVESYLNALVNQKLLVSEEGSKGGFKYKSIAN